MFATFLTVALFATSALASSNLTINTPTFTQCGLTHLSWQGGVAPYNIIALPAGDECADAIVDLGDHSSMSMSWNVTLPAGLEVMLSILDSEGEENWTGTITVAPSSDDSCVPKSLAASVSSELATATAAVANVASEAATPSQSVVAVGAANSANDPLSQAVNGARALTAPMVALGSILGATLLLL